MKFLKNWESIRNVKIYPFLDNLKNISSEEIKQKGAAVAATKKLNGLDFFKNLPLKFRLLNDIESVYFCSPINSTFLMVFAGEYQYDCIKVELEINNDTIVGYRVYNFDSFEYDSIHQYLRVNPQKYYYWIYDKIMQEYMEEVAKTINSKDYVNTVNNLKALADEVKRTVQRARNLIFWSF